MSAHPYKTAPRTAFWSRAVSEGWNASDLIQSEGPLLTARDRVMSAGSCFAANIVPHLEKAGLTYLRTRQQVSSLPELSADNFSYAKFTADYGNIYTTRQLLQLLRRSRGEFSPQEDRWRTGNGIVDPFRPGLKYPAASDVEFDMLVAQHLRHTLEGFAKASVFIFTLGLTEAWQSKIDGSVYPACPGTVAGKFDAELHEFVNFSVSEIVEDLCAFATEVRLVNPGLRLIFTVSPVPLVATATSDHILNATIYSKSVLRAAVGEAVRHIERSSYFPAYEIITGPQAPHSYFEADRRNPSEKGIGEVMRVLLGACETAGAVPVVVRPASPSAAEISKAIADAECEEAASEL
jgi:hypothetical protein